MKKEIEVNNIDSRTGNPKIILHLCAKMGGDSQLYADAGYDVRIIGEDIGVENYNPPENVYGIIANPVCTHFSIARTVAKTPRDLRKGMILVKECYRVVWECQYHYELVKVNQSKNSPLKFWMLENPGTGMLKWFLVEPVLYYQPYEYGDNVSKLTAVWGRFNIPEKKLFYQKPPPKSRLGGEKAFSKNRSVCSPYFAKAFFEANQ